jgi:hypothetical protein
VTRLGAVIVPRRSALAASLRHPFAALTVGKLLRIFLLSRGLHTHASYVGVHGFRHRPPSRDGQLRACRSTMPGGS